MGTPRDKRGDIRPANGGLWPHEIDIGRSVVQDWERELQETWAERKQRLQLDRAERQAARLTAAWAIFGPGGEVIAEGVQEIDLLRRRSVAADTYEPAARVAQEIERALIQHLPRARQAARVKKAAGA